MNSEELSNIITSPDCCPVIAKYIENFSEHMDEESLSVFDEYTAVLSQSKTTKPVEVAEFFALKVIQTTHANGLVLLVLIKLPLIFKKQ